MLHTVDIRNSRRLGELNLDIGRSTEALRKIAEQGQQESLIMANIAQDMKKDSTVMKTVAMMTMFYLPGAFVAVRPSL